VPQPWWEWRPDWWNDWWYPGQARATVVMILYDRPELVDGDPDALPVLLELIRRPEVKTRQVAVSGLAALKSREPAVIDALAEALWDSDPMIRRMADTEYRRVRSILDLPDPTELLPPPREEKEP
jgi:hypothetical protein